MEKDRTPWGPAVIALVFLVLGASAVLRLPEVPAVWIIVVLCVLVAGWQARTAALRYFEPDEPDEPRD